MLAAGGMLAGGVLAADGTLAGVKYKIGSQQLRACRATNIIHSH